jgi:hypothetical protein
LEERAPFADRCLWATAPDVPFGAFATVNRSYPYLDRIRLLGYPVAMGSVITFWEEIPDPQQGRPGDIGALLRRLHALPAPPKELLHTFDPFYRQHSHIRDAAGCTRTTPLSPGPPAGAADRLRRPVVRHAPRAIHGDTATRRPAS